ncbi:MAG TPA: HAMP domain-containing protein, partial [Polyangiaceae bacterium]|nr:HAMP domain-containing protein [Polyangiaceae bacterium]
MTGTPNPSVSPPPYKRRARNYLLDPRFQLKYTGLLVLVALFLSGVLGTQLWFTHKAVISQSQHAVEQGRETVRRGQKTVEESKKVSEVVAMNIAREYADNPELAKLFNADTDKHNKELAAEQMRLQEDAKALESQAAYLAVQQQKTLWVLVGGLAILVVAIALAGIVFTHKIAGPVFKMSGLLRKVGQGQLRIDSGLRKGDELVEFFETFRKMVDRLRERHIDTMERLEQAI